MENFLLIGEKIGETGQITSSVDKDAISIVKKLNCVRNKKPLFPFANGNGHMSMTEHV